MTTQTLSCAHSGFSRWNKDVWISSPPFHPSLSVSLFPSLSPLLLGYWSGQVLWVQRVKAWKAKQPRFQRSHESLKCLLFPPGPGRRVRCESDPRAHLEIQWLNLAHPTLNQSIPIISYCLPSATGPDEAKKEKIPSKEVQGAVLVHACMCACTLAVVPVEGKVCEDVWVWQ